MFICVKNSIKRRSGCYYKFNLHIGVDEEATTQFRFSNVVQMTTVDYTIQGRHC